MSLELIDRLLDNWKNPEYTGFNEMLHYFVFPNQDIDYRRSFRASLDTENSKYTHVSQKPIDSYGSEYNDLLNFYKDHNIKSSYIDNQIKRNIHKLMHTTFDMWPATLARYTNPSSEYILELGFTGGFVSLHMLATTRAQVITIDKMNFDYHYLGKNFIDSKFPGRHNLLVGVPKYLNQYLEDHYKGIKFGLIYINKSREYTHIYNYFKYYKKYAHEDTIIFVKGVTPHEAWGIGAYMAMNKAISDGLLILIEHIELDAYYYASAAILKYNFKENYTQKLPLKKYIQMEYKVLYTEWLSFLKLDYENKTERVNKPLVEYYKNKFEEYGLTFNKPTLDILRDKFNITFDDKNNIDNQELTTI